jgi:hypothetical protein
VHEAKEAMKKRKMKREYETRNHHFEIKTRETKATKRHAVHLPPLNSDGSTTPVKKKDTRARSPLHCDRGT